MSIRVGERVRDCPLARPDGTAARLADFAGRPLLVVFLRHLA